MSPSDAELVREVLVRRLPAVPDRRDFDALAALDRIRDDDREEPRCAELPEVEHDG